MDSCDNAKPLLMLPTELLRNYIYIITYIEANILLLLSLLYPDFTVKLEPSRIDSLNQ